jgi:hypothetical protein
MRDDLPMARSIAIALHRMVDRLRGHKTVPNTGSRARVKKKFQCTPYSVTCSYNYVSKGRTQAYNDGLTGYSDPLTVKTLTRPSRIRGIDLYIDLASRCNALEEASEAKLLVDTTPRENTKDPTPTSIYHQRHWTA